MDDFSISINYLSDQEYKIYNWTNSLRNGTRNSDEGLFFKADLDYKSIHNRYLNIYEEASDEYIKLETLKRIVFLNWESIVEPEYLTGIKELDATAIFKSYKILNEYIIDNKLDEEFIWMLSHYSAWKFVIFNYTENKLSELNSFVNAADTNVLSFPQKTLDKGVMDNRGQMGIYWKPLVEKID
jgi:hypothetical protein